VVYLTSDKVLEKKDKICRVGFLKWTASPFSLIYGGITEIRNLLYEKEIIRASEFDVPSVIVGNLSVGGSGKTPMIKYLAKHFGESKNVAVLSRGYGRKTRGFLEVKSENHPNECGDEPLEIKLSNPEIHVFVCEDRVMGIIELMKLHPKIDLILLDDAFQHRRLKGTVNVLLTEYERPFFKDHLMPIGRLRELRKNYLRADLVVVTKSPNGQFEKGMFVPRIERPTYFSRMKYGDLEHMNGPELTSIDSCILVTAIARPHYLYQYLGNNYSIKHHFDFRDHHNYSTKDADQIIASAKLHTSPIITTEKDWVKLKTLLNDDSVSVYVQPVTMAFEDLAFCENLSSLISERTNSDTHG